MRSGEQKSLATSNPATMTGRAGGQHLLNLDDPVFVLAWRPRNGRMGRAFKDRAFARRIRCA
jgi:hypothetical protein